MPAHLTSKKSHSKNGPSTGEKKKMVALNFRVSVDFKRDFKIAASHCKCLDRIARMDSKLRLAIYGLITKFKSIRLICALVDVKSAYKLSYGSNDNDRND